MQVYEKIKAIREAEGLTQREFADLTGISFSTVSKIDCGAKKDLKVDTLLKVASVEQFQKYSLWLLTDQANPAGGQISPAIKLAANQLKTG